MFIRSLIGLFLLVLWSPILHAQSRHDFVWLLGTPGNSSMDPYYAGSYIDFSNGNPFFESLILPLDMWYPNIMSDESGRLSFYNNGCSIMNAEHQMIENGDELNEGFIHETFCHYPNHPVGYPSYQGHITLPYPEHPGEYFLFHAWVNEEYLTRKLLYTHVDMTANGGQGRVLAKNKELAQDTLSRALTATRHANGRDWWVVSTRWNSSVYYLYLLDPSGISGPFLQQPDAGWIPGHEGTLSNVFSPDGTKYARVGGDAPAAFRIYDFDRCSGVFSNPKTIQIPDTSTYAPWACFSPNSRFLYLQNWGEYLYQYDTWAADISASVQLIGVYDGFLGRHDLPTSFNSLLTGPDGRIYMSCGNGVNYLHTIHRPDEPGLACDFRQHDVVLPSIYPFYLPNMPFYRLYNLPGSPCDTLGVEPPISAFWRSEQDTLDNPLAMIFTDVSYFQPVSWQWNFGDGTAGSTLPSPIHEYPAPGGYEVCLRVCNAVGVCDTLCRVVEIKVVGTAGTEPPIPFEVYPNPAHSWLFISARVWASPIALEIFDVLGRRVLQQQIAASSGGELVNLQALSPGVYFLSLRSGGQVWTRKLVKE
ncbi:MAG: T9SS type A sorting domain-containing protein [Saprospiraceae bacterium]|nr:T9SS type A sorting domain-containing protein [Saprospiraceae bacterium]